MPAFGRVTQAHHWAAYLLRGRLFVRAGCRVCLFGRVVVLTECRAASFFWQGLWNQFPRRRFALLRRGAFRKTLLIKTLALFGRAVIPLRPRRGGGLHGRRRCH